MGNRKYFGLKKLRIMIFEKVIVIKSRNVKIFNKEINRLRLKKILKLFVIFKLIKYVL